jgi:hypothetical protein
VRPGPVVLIVAALATSSCNKASPTEIPVEGGFYTVAADVQNADGLPTLLEYQCLLDGVPVRAAQSFATPQAAASAFGTVDSLGPGSHVFSVRILGQTESPSPYVLARRTITYVVVERGATTTRESFFGGSSDRYATRTGYSIDWSFQIR